MCREPEGKKPASEWNDFASQPDKEMDQLKDEGGVGRSPRSAASRGTERDRPSDRWVRMMILTWCDC